MTKYLRALAAGKFLSEEEAQEAMHILMKGDASDTQIAGFLMGLRSRGESLDELTGFARVMREYMIPVGTGDIDPIDVCGTGGDGSGTFNISTTVAFVCAGAGVPVAKHGNRSVSSNCGSSDVLDFLGVETTLGAHAAERCLQETGICFLMAPLFHPAVGNVMPVRRALAARTFFNVLGPVCNPAGVSRQYVGAFSRSVAAQMAEILSRLGSKKAVVVHSADGLDEMSLTAESYQFVVDKDASGGAIQERTFHPSDLGLQTSSIVSLAGGDVQENARILRSVLAGEPGPKRDVVLLNATFALWSSDRFGSIENCFSAAAKSIDSGAAQRTLNELVSFSAANANASS